MKRYALLLALLLALTGPLNALAEVFPEPQIVLEPDEAEIEVVLPPAEEEVSPGDAEPYEEEIVPAAEELPLFDITDGVLRAYNGAEAEVILPEEVAVIAAGAFEGNHILESVTAGDALTVYAAWKTGIGRGNEKSRPSSVGSAQFNSVRFSSVQIRSDQLLVVYYQLESESELLGGLSAKDHPVHEYLEIFHYGAHFCVYLQSEHDDRTRLADPELRFRDGIVHSVVNVVRG